METTIQPNGPAPATMTLHGGQEITLGGKGGKIAQAWQYIWDQLDREEWKNSTDLAQDAAQRYGIKRNTVTETLCRMRKSGVLEQKMIPLPTIYHRGGEDITMNRPRVHYRIASKP